MSNMPAYVQSNFNQPNDMKITSHKAGTMNLYPNFPILGELCTYKYDAATEILTIDTFPTQYAPKNAFMIRPAAGVNGRTALPFISISQKKVLGF